MDRGGCRAVVHEVAKSWTRLSTRTHVDTNANFKEEETGRDVEILVEYTVRKRHHGLVVRKWVGKVQNPGDKPNPATQGPGRGP